MVSESRRVLRSLILLLLVAVVALPAMALIVPESTPVREKAMRNPALHIPTLYSQVSQLPAGQRPALNLELAALGVDPGTAWLDQRGGRWVTLMPAEPLIPGTGVGNQLAWKDFGGDVRGDVLALQRTAWDAFVGYLRDYRNQLHIDVNELTDPGSITVVDGGNIVQIIAPRLVNGVPVRDSYVLGIINHGNLILVGAANWGDVNVSTAPTVFAEEAMQTLQSYLGSLNVDGTWRKNYTILVPTADGNGYRYRLAWVLHPAFGGDLGRWEALVDAHSGELLSFQDTAHYAVAEEALVPTTRTVVGGVLPVSNDGTPPDGVEQSGWPMPFSEVINNGVTRHTDSGGNLLTCVDGTITTHLNGQFMMMTDTCGAINESTTGTVLDLGTSAGTDCVVPMGHSGGDTHATRSGFFELNRIKELARAQLPNNTWLQDKLTANMNINQTCNANYTGQLNFFRSGGGCGNTGEIAGVYDHEWGHGMDDHSTLAGISNPGEGIADIFAELRINTSCMGRGFFLGGGNCSGYGDPCTACSGVRDNDFAKHVSGLPLDITRLTSLCPGGSDPCGREVHCAGQIYAQAVYDLVERDLTAGVFNYDHDRALELATRLTYVGSGPVGAWYSCVQGSGGCPATSGYMNYLAADDDNGMLSDGTPHMTAIHAAFDRHGIACATPTVQDSGCAGAPTTAPTVTPTPMDRGVRLDWTSVAGATKYFIYRTDSVFGCDFGKVKVGETMSTKFEDAGLLNGHDYQYTVAAIGPSDICIGPMSSCTTVTPAAGANLSIDIATTAVTPTTGDGDDFLDNCEQATVDFDVVNIGNATQNNVRILAATVLDPPGTQITTSFPSVIAGSLAACGTAQGSLDVVAGGLSYDDTLRILVVVTSDELGGSTRTAVIEVPHTESDFQHYAVRNFTYEADTAGWTVTSGTFTRQSAGGGGGGSSFYLRSSSGLDDQCDRVRSPLMKLAADSTLSLWNNYQIEPFSSGTWYDRANVGVIKASDGSRTIVNPSAGRLYNAGPGGPGTYSGCNDGQMGWADSQATWGTSSWSAAALMSPTFAGQLVQLEVTYSTDAALALDGFRFDQVVLTNVDFQVPDTQTDGCTIFADGFESGDLSAWSAVVP